MTALATSAETFGGFSLGGMQLALPIAALREVAAAEGLIDLPCALPCVIGGLVLRAVVIPVIDLRIALGRSASEGGAQTVVVIADDDRLFGLLADAVTGMFESVEGSLRRAGDAAESLFCATVQRADNSEMVSVLSARALAAFDGLPLVEDPLAARRRTDLIESPGDDHRSVLPMLLFDCNTIQFAIDTSIVRSVLFRPTIEVRQLAGSQDLRMIAYDGVHVPVLDLLELCGLGALADEKSVQAFIVSLPAGFVAFLLSNVMDIVSTRTADVQPIPNFALPRPELIAGSLAARRADVLATSTAPLMQYLVIDAAGLQTCDEAVTSSELNVADGDGRVRGTEQAGAATTGARQRPMLTYVLDSEWASPLEQVLEIRRYVPGTQVFPGTGPLLGLMEHRGRSVPVLCLSQLTGGAFSARSAGATALLVDAEGDLVAFAVDRLTSIEEADWEPVMRALKTADPAGNRTAAVIDGTFARFGSRASGRLVPMLDLRAIAVSLRTRSLALAGNATPI